MSEKNNFLKFILITGDVFLLYLSLLLVLAIRYGDFSFLPGPQSKIFIYHFSFIYISWLLILYIFDFYNPFFLKRIYDFFRSLIIFLFLASATGVIYFYLQPQLAITPKRILLFNVLIFTLFFTIWRFIFSRVFNLLELKEKIVIIGNPTNFSALLSDSLAKREYEIIAFFDPNSSRQLFSNLAKYGLITDFDKLKKILTKEGINTLTFTPESYKNEELAKNFFLNFPPQFNFVSFTDFYESLTKKVPLEAIDELWFLENISRVERKLDEILKRGFDILFSLIGLLVVAILFPFFSICIKLDSPGPIFFLQKRLGRNGKTFTLYKFRTMKADPNQEKEFWREKDENQVTGVGKFLRRFYIDELPQFLNIFKGDISFVGPRPEWVRLAKMFEKEIPFYSFRYIIRPGLTGWAQLNFPASISIEEAKEKFQYDLYYIKNRSFFFDLAIILKTFRLLFK